MDSNTPSRQERRSGATGDRCTAASGWPPYPSTVVKLHHCPREIPRHSPAAARRALQTRCRGAGHERMTGKCNPREPSAKETQPATRAPTEGALQGQRASPGNDGRRPWVKDVPGCARVRSSHESLTWAEQAGGNGEEGPNRRCARLPSYYDWNPAPGSGLSVLGATSPRARCGGTPRTSSSCWAGGGRPSSVSCLLTLQRPGSLPTTVPLCVCVQVSPSLFLLKNFFFSNFERESGGGQRDNPKQVPR